MNLALELNEYMCEFIISVRTKDGKDYGPSSLRSLFGKFWTTSKEEQLLCQYHEWPRIWENKDSPPVQIERVKREKRKRNKSNASIALSSDQLNTLYEKGLLGTRNPEALLNTLWLNNTMHVGLRGCKEDRDVLERCKVEGNGRRRGISGV